jgi:predicted XRE-type DNA-binding protein
MTNDETDLQKAEWLTALRAELDELDATDRFLVVGEWITYISLKLLPDLAARRRGAVLELLEANGATNSSVAAVLGIRKPTIDRLVEEGRSAKKREQVVTMREEWDETLAPSPPLPVG